MLQDLTRIDDTVPYTSDKNADIKNQRLTKHHEVFNMEWRHPNQTYPHTCVQSLG